MLDSTDTITQNVSDVETEAAPSAPAITTRPKASTSFDATALAVTVTLPGGTPKSYALSALSDAVKSALLGKGFAHYLTTRTGGPDAAYEALKSGSYGSRKSAAPKELDGWRLAIAHAAVEETKKADVPLTLDQAKERARGIDRERLTAAKTNPLVVKHYAKLNPSDGGSVAGLLG